MLLLCCWLLVMLLVACFVGYVCFNVALQLGVVGLLRLFFLICFGGGRLFCCVLWIVCCVWLIIGLLLFGLYCYNSVAYRAVVLFNIVWLFVAMWLIVAVDLFVSCVVYLFVVVCFA